MVDSDWGIVSSFIDPRDFYVQFERDLTVLERITESVDEFCTSALSSGRSESSKKCVNDLILAQWNEDGNWYRAVITDILDNGSYRVTFIDFGNSVTVSPTQILSESTQHLFSNKAVAHRCCFHSPERTMMSDWEPILPKIAREMSDDSKRMYFEIVGYSISRLEVKIYTSEENQARKLDLLREIAPSAASSSITSSDTSFSCSSLQNYPQRPPVDDTEIGLVVYVKSVDEFYVQINKEEEDLNAAYSSLSSVQYDANFSANVKDGEPCVLLHSLDSSYYRGQFLSRSWNSSSIKLVDFGEIVDASQNSIFPPCPSMMKYPAFGLHCKINVTSPSKRQEGYHILQQLMDSSSSVRIRFVTKTAPYNVVLTATGSSQVLLADETESAVPRSPVKSASVSPSKSTVNLPKRPSLQPGNRFRGAIVYETFETDGVVYAQTATDEEESEKIQAMLESPELEILSRTEVEVGLPCVAPYEGALYRALVVSIDGGIVKVHFVDFGNTESVSVSSLQRMTSELTAFPPLCIKCKFASGQSFYDLPVDDSGAVVPSEFEVIGGDEKCWIISLLKGDTASPAVATVPTYPAASHKVGESFKASFSAVTKEVGGLSFCQPEAANDLLEQITDTIDSHGSAMKSVERGQCQKGMACIAPHEDDDQFYRAVISNVSGDQVTVQFIDFGNTRTVPITAVKETPESLLLLPSIGIPVKLSADQAAAVEVDADFYNLKLVEGDDVSGWKVRINEEADEGPSDSAPQSQPTPTDQSNLGIQEYAIQTVSKGDHLIGYFSFVASEENQISYFQAVETADNLESIGESIDKSLVDVTQLPGDQAYLGQACLAQDVDDVFYRAIITRRDGDNATVRFVDYGTSRQLPAAELKRIPPSLLTTPIYIVSVCLKSEQAMGIDYDREDYDLEIIGGDQTNGWRVAINGVAPKQETEAAISDSNTKSPGPSVSPPRPNSYRYKESSLTVGEKLVGFFSYVSGKEGKLSYFQTSELYDELQEKITVHLESEEFPDFLPSDVMVGQACVSPDVDEMYYRATITQVLVDEVQVLFIDYGTSRVLPVTELKRASSHLLSFPMCIVPVLLDDNQMSSIDMDREDYEIHLCGGGAKSGWIVKIGDPAAGDNEESVSAATTGESSNIELESNSPQISAEQTDDVTTQATPTEPPVSDKGVTPARYAPSGSKSGDKMTGYFTFVCAVEGELSYFQSLEMTGTVEEVTERLGELVDSCPCLPESEVQNGQPCLAQDVDEVYYRAVIVGKSGTNVTVLFVDYGTSNELPSTLLKCVPQELLSYPMTVSPLLLTNVQMTAVDMEREDYEITLCGGDEVKGWYASFGGMAPGNSSLPPSERNVEEASVEPSSQPEESPQVEAMPQPKESTPVQSPPRPTAESTESAEQLHPEESAPVESPPGPSAETATNPSQSSESTLVQSSPSSSVDTDYIPVKLQIGDSVKGYFTYVPYEEGELCYFQSHDMDESAAVVSKRVGELLDSCLRLSKNDFTVGLVCLAQDDEVYYRAKITDADELRVHFVDYGTSTSPCQPLLQLPSELLAHPACAIPLKLDEAQMCELDVEKEKVIHIIGGDHANGWVVSVACCDPEAAQASDLGVSKNSQSSAAVNRYPSRPEKIGCIIQVSLVLFGDSPEDLSYFQLVDDESKANIIDDVLEKSECDVPLPPAKLVACQACLAPHEDDDQYYRAMITDVNANMVSVWFVDYGNCREKLDPTLLRCLPNELLSIPALAIPVCLNNSQQKVVEENDLLNFKLTSGSLDGWTVDIVDETSAATLAPLSSGSFGQSSEIVEEAPVTPSVDEIDLYPCREELGPNFMKVSADKRNVHEALVYGVILPSRNPTKQPGSGDTVQTVYFRSQNDERQLMEIEERLRSIVSHGDQSWRLPKLDKKLCIPYAACLVHDVTKKSWYRGQLVNLNDDETVEVRLVDYGDQRMVGVSLDHLHRLPKWLRGVAPLCLPCHPRDPESWKVVASHRAVVMRQVGADSSTGVITATFNVPVHYTGDQLRQIGDRFMSSDTFGAQMLPRPDRPTDYMDPDNGTVAATVVDVTEDGFLQVSLVKQQSKVRTFCKSLDATYQTIADCLVPVVRPHINGAYVSRDGQGRFARVRIVSVCSSDETYLLNFIDYGQTQRLSSPSFYIILPHVSSEPPFCWLCTVVDQPLSHHLTKVQRSEIRAILSSHVFYLEFVPSTSTLPWWHPHRVVISEANLKPGAASALNRFQEILSAAISDESDVSDTKVNEVCNVKIPTRRVPNSHRMEVRITYVESPNLFWCREIDTERSIERIQASLLAVLGPADSSSALDDDVDIVIGGFYALMSSWGWRRIQVIDWPTDQAVIVQCVDDGRRAEIPPSQLRYLPDQGATSQIPCLALRCTLFGIAAPAGGTRWSDEACFRFQDLAMDGTWVATVRRQVRAARGHEMEAVHHVTLCRPDDPHDSVAEVLLYENVAVRSSVGGSISSRPSVNEDVDSELDTPGVNGEAWQFASGHAAVDSLPPRASLPDDAEVEVIITRCDSLADFWVVPTAGLSRLEQSVQALEDFPPLLENIPFPVAPDDPPLWCCIVRDDKICRVLLEVFYDEQNLPKTLLQFVDEGWYQEADSKEDVSALLREMPNVEWLLEPWLAVRCSLDNSTITDETLLVADTTAFKKRMHERRPLSAFVTGMHIDGRFIVALLDRTDGVDVSAETLVNEISPRRLEDIYDEDADPQILADADLEEPIESVDLDEVLEEGYDAEELISNADLEAQLDDSELEILAHEHFLAVGEKSREFAVEDASADTAGGQQIERKDDAELIGEGESSVPEAVRETETLSSTFNPETLDVAFVDFDGQCEIVELVVDGVVGCESSDEKKSQDAEERHEVTDLDGLNIVEDENPETAFKDVQIVSDLVEEDENLEVKDTFSPELDSCEISPDREQQPLDPPSSYARNDATAVVVDENIDDLCTVDGEEALDSPCNNDVSMVTVVVNVEEETPDFDGKHRVDLDESGIAEQEEDRLSSDREPDKPDFSVFKHFSSAVNSNTETTSSDFEGFWKNADVIRLWDSDLNDEDDENMTPDSPFTVRLQSANGLKMRVSLAFVTAISKNAAERILTLTRSASEENGLFFIPVVSLNRDPSDGSSRQCNRCKSVSGFLFLDSTISLRDSVNAKLVEEGYAALYPKSCTCEDEIFA